MQGASGEAEVSDCLKRGRGSRSGAAPCPWAARAQPAGSKQEIKTERIQPAHRMGHKSNEGDKICAVLNGQICTGAAARSVVLNQERGQAWAAVAFPSAQSTAMLSAKGQQPWAQLWVCLWVPSHPVCAVSVGSDLGEFSASLPCSKLENARKITRSSPR